MKQGSGHAERSAVAFVAFLIVLSAGARWLRPAPAPVVPADGTGLDLGAYRAKAQRALDAETERTRPLAAGERIAVNRADADQLMRLPGVGMGLAARIVADRAKNGGFRTVADLTRVPGIGSRSAKEMARHVDFSGAGPPGRASSAMTSRRRASLPTPASRYDLPATSSRTGPGQPGSGARMGGAGASGRTVVVDVNRANAAQLQRLRGIGPALARRIIAYRDSAGPFRSVDDLVAVPGIGPATLKRIRANVRVR